MVTGLDRALDALFEDGAAGLGADGCAHPSKSAR